MFDYQETRVDRSVHYPSTINVHEHRAPTDESVKILNEMEEKALENVVLKISEVRNNKFSYSVIFTRLAQLSLSTKGILFLKVVCNGKEYKRKVPCSGSIITMAVSNRKECNVWDLDSHLRSYILFQISFLIAQILLDVDSKSLENLFELGSMADACKFDVNKITEEIDEWFYY